MSPKAYFNYSWSLDIRKRYTRLPFPISEYERRIGLLEQALEDAHLDGLLIPGDVRERGNVRWLTNFYPLLGHTIVAFKPGDDPIIVTTAAVHGEPMHSYVYDTWVPDIRAALGAMPPPDAPLLAPTLVGTLKDMHLEGARLGIPRWSLLSHDVMDYLRAELPRAQFSDATRLYELCKAQKSDLEVQLIRAAQRAGDSAILAGLRAAMPGTSELEVCAAIEASLRENGVEAVSNLFDTRVCSGERSFLKNAAPTARRLRDGDLLFMDISASYYGYVLDCCASTVVGGHPTPQQESLLECGARMVEACIAASRPGTPARELVSTVKSIAVEMGEAQWFIPYMAGHGMGCSQLEIPHIYPYSDDVLAPNQWYALECMVSDPERGTGQMEGIVLITPEGSEYLSEVPLRPWRDL